MTNYYLWLQWCCGEYLFRLRHAPSISMSWYQPMVMMVKFNSAPKSVQECIVIVWPHQLWYQNIYFTSRTTEFNNSKCYHIIYLIIYRYVENDDTFVSHFVVQNLTVTKLQHSSRSRVCNAARTCTNAGHWLYQNIKAPTQNRVYFIAMGTTHNLKFSLWIADKNELFIQWYKVSRS